MRALRTALLIVTCVALGMGTVIAADSWQDSERADRRAWLREKEQCSYLDGSFDRVDPYKVCPELREGP